jgi:hypothetical protein
MAQGLGLELIEVANGIEDLAALVVAEFKAGPGGIYLFPSGSRDHDEDYRYYVRKSARGWCPIIKIQDDEGNTLFEGYADEVYEWCCQQE